MIVRPIFGIATGFMVALNMRLSLELTEAQQDQLNAIAQRLNVPADALAAAALRDLLDRREATYEAAAAHVIEKNAELYRRLA